MRPHLTPALLLPLAMASGFAGLSYELVWTRMLALSLGTEMTAVLGVVTGFFAGLALGALLLDAPIRRARNPALAFALLEAAIGLSALASAALLPVAGRMVAAALGTTPAPAMQAATAFLFPALLLLPATAAMGGTLVALERLLAAARIGRAAAAAYALNTAGAVLGALASVQLLLPALGLWRSLLVLAAVNAGCALVSVLLAPGDTADTPAASESSGLRLTGLALFGTGLLGIAFEVTVVRLAAQVLEDTVFTFASLLAAYLLGTALGGWWWRQRGHRVPLPVLLAAIAGSGLVTAGLLPLLATPGPAALLALPGGELAAALLLFLLPSAAGGAVFAALLQSARQRGGTMGRAVGINALGAAAAAPLTALVLIPVLEAWPVLVALSLAYALAGLWCGRRAPGRWVPLAPALAAAALLLLARPSLLRVPEGGAVLAWKEGATATAAMVTDAAGTRFLEVNGHFRMGGTSSLRSDWRQAQIPLLLHPGPRRALFLGVGTGATLEGAAALDGVAATGVELLPEVVALLPGFAAAAAPPPVITADARRFVQADRTQYDAVVADLFHPALDGSGALYTVEHFRAVRERLAPGGVFCQWLPLYQLDPASLRTIIRSFLAAFPEGGAWLAHLSLQTPMLALIGHQGEPAPAAAGLEGRIARWSQPLRRTGITGPVDVLGLFVADAPALAAFAGPGPLNTDDRPAVAFDARANLQALHAPPFRTLLVLLDGLREEGAAPGQRYRQARDRFLKEGAALPEGLEGRALIERAAPGLLAALRISPAFDPAFLPLLSMVEALWRTDRPAAAALFRAVAEAAPGRPELQQVMRRLAR